MRVAASTPMNAAANSWPKRERGQRDRRRRAGRGLDSGGLDPNPNDVPLSVDCLDDLRRARIIALAIETAEEGEASLAAFVASLRKALDEI